MLTITTAPSQPWQRWFWMLLLLNILFFIAMYWYLQPLTAGDMVRYEVAKTASSATSIIEQWRLEGKYDKALQGVYLNFIFIILYSAGLSVACIFFSHLTHHEILIRAGRFLSWCMIIVAVCGIVENIIIWQSLMGNMHPFAILVKHNMAVTKFSGIILTTLFIVVCLLFWIIDVFTSPRKEA